MNLKDKSDLVGQMVELAINAFPEGTRPAMALMVMIHEPRDGGVLEISAAALRSQEVIDTPAVDRMTQLLKLAIRDVCVQAMGEANAAQETKESARCRNNASGLRHGPSGCVTRERTSGDGGD